MVATLSRLVEDYRADPRPIFLTEEELLAIELAIDEMRGEPEFLAGAL